MSFPAGRTIPDMTQMCDPGLDDPCRHAEIYTRLCDTVKCISTANIHLHLGSNSLGK